MVRGEREEGEEGEREREERKGRKEEKKIIMSTSERHFQTGILIGRPRLKDTAGSCHGGPF